MESHIESPTPEPKAGKNQKGCTYLLIRVGVALVVLLIFDYAVTLIFNSSYPHDNTTNALIPFQNNFLARTDAFITSEAATTEFGNDTGIAGRFLALSILPVACLVILSIFLFIIPFTKNLLDYFWYGFGIVLITVMIRAMFIPPVMTIFDRERKVMTVYISDWVFFGTKTEIPFDRISGFASEAHVASGYGHYDDARYVDLFATTPDGRIFIADNQVDASISKTEQPEVDAAILALNLLIGKNPMEPPADVLQNGK